MHKTLVRKWFVVAFMLLIAFTTANALFVEVGSGTEAVATHPIGSFWDYGWSGSVYLQTEIGQSMEITEISYQMIGDNSDYTTDNVTIYMKNSTQTDFHTTDYIDAANDATYTLVFSGSITFTSPGWTTIPLDTPFQYDGTSNLVIACENNDGSYETNYNRYECFIPTEQNRTVYKVQDNSFPAVAGTYINKTPNIRFHYDLPGAPGRPTNPTPVNNAEDVALATDLTWTNGENTDECDVYFSTDETLVTTMDATALVADGTTTTSYTPTLALNTMYYWRVVAKNANVRLENPGSVWKFKTTYGSVSTFPWTENFDATTETPDGWLQPTDRDDYDWSFGASTPSTNTGPANGDHTSGTGNFAYTEASSQLNGRFDLVTPSIDPSSLTSPLLKFWYLMRGDDMGSLDLDIYDETQGIWIEGIMPQLFGDLGEEWREVMVDLSSYQTTTFKLRFRGVTGADYDSDIAIDDIWVGEAPVTGITEVRPDSYNFAETEIFVSGGEAYFTIRNAGVAAIEISSVALAGTNAGEFALADTIVSYPQTLNMGEEYAVKVSFYPVSAGAKTAELVVTDNLTRNVINIPITATAVASGTTITDFPFTEDFDRSTDTPVNWVQVTYDDADWRFGDDSGYGNSGPQNGDHTSGTGNFAWLENTSPYNKTAEMFTPVIDVTSLTNPMVKLYYLMYGAALGSLHVDAYNSTTNEWVNDLGIINGEVDQEWHEMMVDLAGFTGLTRIRFRAVGGTGSLSDVAIDDIWVGEAPVNPVFEVMPSDTLAFGEQNMMTTSGYQSVMVRNAGGGSLVLSTPSITGTNPTEFILDDEGTYPMTLTTGQVHTFRVAFSPENTGLKRADLVLTDNLTRNTYNIMLTGEGVGENPHFGGGDVTTQGGYYYANSTTGAATAPSQPTYSWVDITTTGTALTDLDGDDQLSNPVDIPFAFPFFGQSYNQVKICTNGWITFDTSVTSTAYNETEIPDDASAYDPHTAIYWFWTDLDPNDSDHANDGHMVYTGTDTFGNFVITYEHWPIRASTGNAWITAQILLSPNGKIKIQYKEVGPGFDGATLDYRREGTVGLENQDETMGVQYWFQGGPGVVFDANEQIAVAFGTDANTLDDYTGATSSITGIVTDEDSGSPIEGVEVYLGMVRAITGTDGVYLFENIVPDTYELKASRTGYYPYGPQSFTFTGGESLNHNFTMDMYPQGVVGAGSLVTAAVDNSPIENAKVVVTGTIVPDIAFRDSTMTDSTGNYSFAIVPTGDVTFTCSHPMYDTATQTINVADGATVAVPFSLTRPAGGTTVDPLIATFDAENIFRATGDSRAYDNDYFFHPTATGTHTGQDLVFEVNLASAATLHISTEGSSYDTYIGVFAGSSATFTATDTLAYNDDWYEAFPTFPIVPSNTNLVGQQLVLASQLNNVANAKSLSLSTDLTAAPVEYQSTNNVENIKNTRSRALQSYLNVALDAGRYFVILDGYGTASGTYQIAMWAEGLVTAYGSAAGKVVMAGTTTGIENATVTAMLGGTTFNTTTDANGDYTFTNIPIGTYSFVADHDYYLPNTVTDVVITENAQTQVPDIELTNDTGVLPPPMGLTATVEGSNVTLRWNAPVNPFTLLSYKVYRDDNMIAEGITDTMYVDENVPNAIYTYKVTAVYQEGTSSHFSNPVEVMVNAFDVLPPENCQFQPRAYTSELGGQVMDIDLTWESPVTVNTALRYDDGDNHDGVGSGNAEDFDVFIRFDQNDLSEYHGMYLNSVDFFPKEEQCEYSLRVYTGGSYNGTDFVPGTLVVDQVIPGDEINVNTWNTVGLAAPLQINSYQELWVGYRCNTTTGAPAGCDNGPVSVPGKSNLIKFQGTWYELNALGSQYPFNWNIAANISIINAAANTRAIQGFNIYRSFAGADSTLVQTIGIESHLEDGTYAWTDVRPTGGTYRYMITSVYHEGESDAVTSPEISVTDKEDTSLVPKATCLKGNYPNPFNPTTTFEFSLAEDSNVRIDIFNIKGQKVRSVVNKHFKAGNQEVVFDGKADTGKTLSSGIYFYKMKTARYTSTKKMILLK